MGEVYLAQDEHLQRDVAIKVLPQGTLPDDAARKRFRREALALARLSHPNIETIHDFDTQDGIDFLAAEFIPGATLADRIATGPLREKEVVALGMQIAAALQEAHGSGVVHRDLKPANIIVTPKGQAKVIDFGLAKLIEPAGYTASTQSAGDTRGAAGTLPYMAPEQLRGEAVDARTDIHAVGAVFYEMASGRRPFPEDTAPRLTDAILHQAPVAPRALNPRLSPRLEEIILKCLDKEPARRYQSAKELHVDLQRLSAPAAQIAAAPRRRFALPRLLAPALAVAAVLALLVALDVGGLRQRLTGGIEAPRIESLAVLPLENLSGDPNQEVFVNGMTEALTSELSKIKALKKVISRTSAMQYKGTGKPIRQIAGELDVDALVEGSALREGDIVRITVQLIHGRTDAHLWANSFDREYKNILVLHNDVARAIAREIRVALTPEKAEVMDNAPVVNPEAYDCYLRGIEYINEGDEERNVRGAIQKFQESIELDPHFAPAYAALSESHAYMWWLHYERTTERVAMAKAAVDRALRLQPNLSEAHRALGHYYYWYQSDYDRALQEFTAAQQLKPNDSRIALGIGAVLRRQGKVKQALVHHTKANALDPLSALATFTVGETHALLRNRVEADRYYDLTMKLTPTWPAPYAYKVLASLRLAGDVAGARNVIENARRLGLADDPLVAYCRILLGLYEGDFKEILASDPPPSESLEAFDYPFFWFIPRALLLAQICDLSHQPHLAMGYYESARKMADARVRQQPEDARYRGTLGLAYAGLGRKQDAIREGKRGAELLPMSKEAYRGFYRVEELARIYVMVGEYDAAIGQLEYLMSVPGDLGVGALRLDPVWQPIRNQPRFQAMIHKYSQ